jgi:hypothetical protein
MNLKAPDVLTKNGMLPISDDAASSGAWPTDFKADLGQYSGKPS